jgi:cell volume regulation protein A
MILLGGGLLLLSILAGLISSRVGAPLLLVFLGLGMLAGEDGPGGIVFNDFQGAYTLASVALAVILFDGGLRTPLRTVRSAWGPASALATVGVVITAILTGVAAHFAFGVDWPTALLMGTVVASTDAAAVFLLLHQHNLDIRRRVAATLELESGANDPMAIFLTLTLVEFLAQGLEGDGLHLSLMLVQRFALSFGIGALFGIGGGMLLGRLVNRMNLAPGLYPVFVVAAALAIFGAVQSLGGSGFLAVYLAGIAAGNQRLRANTLIRRFHDGIAWVSQILLLVILGLLVTPHALEPYLLPGVAVALALVFVARPLAVFLCLIPTDFRLEERFFIAFVGLRGAVPIYLAMIPVLAELEASQQIFAATFVVVLASLVLQGWSVPWVARHLDVQIPPAPEQAGRLDVDLPSQMDRDVVGYAIKPDSPMAGKPISDLKLPNRARILAVLRNNYVVPERILRDIKIDDYVLLIAPPEHTMTLDRKFLPSRRKARNEALALVDFTFPGAAPMAAVAAAYELPMEEQDQGRTLAEVVQSRLKEDPSRGDRVTVGTAQLIIMDMDGEVIASVGIRLDPPPPALVERIRQASHSLRDRLRAWRKKRDS